MSELELLNNIANGATREIVYRVFHKNASVAQWKDIKDVVLAAMEGALSAQRLRKNDTNAVESITID